MNRGTSSCRWLLLVVTVLLIRSQMRGAERTSISLDGTWEIEDSKDADAIPVAWRHHVRVPGLAHLAQPPFEHVDEFDSRQLILNRVRDGKLPKNSVVRGSGVSHQDRNWFWYRRVFAVPALRAVAMLRINKAQFGTAVWVNGMKVGEHLPCFTSATLDISKTLRDGHNEVIVRVGAHPGVLPLNVSAGTDFEKIRWTPGIYDNVSVFLSDNPFIESVQVAPHINDSSIRVQTVVRNYGKESVTFSLTQHVHEWQSSRTVADAEPLSISLKPDEIRVVDQTVTIPGAHLWTPEAPNLYIVDSASNGDSVSTRFGMREFRFDTSTKRAYLNGHVYFMRGSNITLHRFFEDPISGDLPWNEGWVHKLLIDLPHEMHWNSFRFCIGPVPDRWLDIADEAGLLIQNEYFVWTGHDWHGPQNQVHFDSDEMIQEYKEWIRDNWNHPSVAIWDANNETWDPSFGEKIIPSVRALDLSRRPWENSYNPPEGSDDPVEDHPYEFQAMADGGAPFNMTTLESPGGISPGAPSAHALILNEYGWLWLNRDGSPTELTKKLYPALLGPATAEQRLHLNAYLLAGLTEYWRAYRQYAGVLHFVYLTSSEPGGYTSDHFEDVRTLRLHSAFKDYMSNAFSPVGVYLSFWQSKVESGSTRSIPVMLVNDEDRQVKGTLTLTVDGEEGVAENTETVAFEMAAFGQVTLYKDVHFPRKAGRFLLRGAVRYAEDGKTRSVYSRREISLEERVAP
jgi:beta-galactosidase